MPDDARTSANARSIIIEMLKFSIIALLIVTPFRLFVAQPFIVSGASMEPTFHPSEYLVIDQLSYRFEEPVRGDIVVLRYPHNPSVYFIKRVIGLPGERVVIQGGAVSVYDDDEEVHTLTEPYLASDVASDEGHSIMLGENEYFVLGDNRDASSDSRAWGPLRRELITGRVIMRLFPIHDAELFPGEYRYAE